MLLGRYTVVCNVPYPMIRKKNVEEEFRELGGYIGCLRWLLVYVVGLFVLSRLLPGASSQDFWCLYGVFGMAFLVLYRLARWIVEILREM